MDCDSRGAGVVGEVLDGHRPTLWVSDLYGAQQGHAESWQVCRTWTARLPYAIEAGDTVFAPRMKALLLRAVVLACRSAIWPKQRARLTEGGWTDLNRVMILAPEQRDGRRLRRRYGKVREYLFTFLTHPEVTADNNSSERELRPTATYRKVTGGFRSHWGADLFAAVRSVIGTAKRRGIDAYQAIAYITRTGCARRAEAAQVSARAAEQAIQENSKTLFHAREVADRDFRPWLTVTAELVSEVGTRYSLEEREITFFIKLTCVNVGRVAASHIIYRVRGIDESLVGNIDGWFEENIRKSADFILREGDALIPSERHVSRHWCRIPGPEEDSHWVTDPKPNRIGKFCVGIFVAYRGESGDERVFHTAKVLPVGDPNLVEFFPLISIDEFPKGTGDVALGPVYVARAT